MFNVFKRVNAKSIRLPANGLSSLVRYYESYSGGDVPVVVVAIYNVEQLADEIVQRLKDRTGDCCNDDNNS